MIRFPQQQRQRWRPIVPKNIEPRPAAAMYSTEQESETESQQQQQQQQQVERDGSPEYRPHPPRPLRPYTYQASGRVHPRSPSEDQDSSSSNKRPKLDETRKSEPGKFSAVLSSLDNRSNATTFDDDGSFGYAGEPAPSMFGFELLEGGCAISGSCGQGDDQQTGTARQQDLLAQLRALETRQVELDNWEKNVEDKFAWLISAREAAREKLAWLRREEEAMKRMLMWLPDELRMVEERRARAMRELAVIEGRGETVLNQFEGLEGGSGNGNENENGAAGGEKDEIVTDEEMIG
ncbi:hypothetical protein EMPG_12987 [Blastomyces silverae]|uniref:Uncharacterized protein n=1 Tax=Blastomyces silverae TaxID=2060906 RepID=A0A0H1BRV7_9EURO|nr:hypothetical protein EMPG_12987 [Blastomyces silverae]